jgi:hypothetical protein
MKCEHCGFEGRGQKGWYKNNVKGEMWKCPACSKLTEISKTSKPKIKGFCKDCTFSFKLFDKLDCQFIKFEIKEESYCSFFEQRK